MKAFLIISFSILLTYSLLRPFSSFWARIFAISGCLSAILFIVGEEYTNKLSLYLGVSRGADLFLYLGLLATFSFIIFVVNRMKRTDDKINKLVQELAILSKRIDD